MRKSVPKALAVRQEDIKSSTIIKLQQAIDDLRAEGFPVTKKLLLERTGFSNSLLSKKHVKDLFKENEVCQFRSRRIIPRPTNPGDVIAQLESQLTAARKKITLLEKEANHRKKYADELHNALEDAKEEIKLLRGQLFVFVEKARILGIELERLPGMK